MLVENNPNPNAAKHGEVSTFNNTILNKEKLDDSDNNEIDMMSFCTVVENDYFDDFFDENDSLNVDSWSITSTIPASPFNASDNMDTIKKQQDLSTSSSADMDSADERKQKCLYDIPHKVTMKLIKSLDMDEGWEKLAAAAGFNFEDMFELKQEERKMNGSPARSLLWKLGCRAYTVAMLCDKLLQLDRITDAETIATYIREGDRRSRPPPTSKNSDLLSYLNRMTISNTSNNPPVQQPMYFGASNYHTSTASEVNFNNQSMADTSQTKLAGGFKNYDDKLIPGANSALSYQSHGPSAAPAFVSSQYSIPSSSSSDNNNRHLLPSGGTDQPPFFTGSSSRLVERPTRVLREVGQPSTLMSSQSHAQIAMSIKASFSYQELVTATDSFNEKNILGEGGFGVVYYGHLRHLDCAVKRFIKQRSEENKDSTEQIHSELAALLKYQHENIVTLYGYALDGPQLCLVYQYLSNGSLEDRLMRKNNTPSLSWERRLNILMGSCRAISFLHTMGSTPLIHGDIKSANILLDSHMEAKFADLGQSRYATGRSTNTGGLTHITIAQSTSRQYGSTAYQAPEIKSCCSISTQSDIYAMGVVMLEVCSGMSAYDYNRNENKILTDFYLDYFAKLGKPILVQEFQDKTPPDCIHTTPFLDILKLAGQCISEIKKARPKSGKLVERMKKIYDDQYKEQCFPKTLNSPTEDDISNTNLSHYNSHMSDRVISNELNSSAPHRNPHQPSPSPPPSHQQSQMPSILQMQEDRLQQLAQNHYYHHHNQQQQKNPHHSIQNSSPATSKVPFNVCASNPKSLTPSNPSIANPSYQFEKNRGYNQQSSCPEQSPSPSSQPSISQFYSIPANKPLPESLILQQHYDNQQTSSQNEVLNPNRNSNLSDSNTQSSVRNPVEQGEIAKPDGENIPTSFASDPGKLAAMKMFDELGYQSKDTQNNPVDTSSPVSLKCDEKKMAYLKNFDDQAFKSSKGNENSKTGVDCVKKNDDGMKDGSYIHNSGGVGGCSGNVIHQNAKDVTREAFDNVSSSEQVCNSDTNLKEIEALGQNRQHFLRPSHHNSCIEVDGYTSPSHPPSSSYEIREDSQSRSKDANSTSLSNDGVQIEVEKKEVNSGNVSNQQRLANRENMFLCYNAGNDDDDDDDDGEEDDEYVDEGKVREEKYV